VGFQIPAGWSGEEKKTLPSLGIPTPDRPARSLDTEADCELKIRGSNPDRGKSFNRHTLYTYQTVLVTF